MGKSTPPQDFHIHVDPSCLTDSTDLEMPKQREPSGETILDNAPEEETEPRPSAYKATEEDRHENLDQHSELINERIQAQIHEAARRVVADIEREHYEEHEDSILTTQTDESYGREPTELTYDGTEATYESEQDYETEEYRGESELDAQMEQALTAWEPEHHNTETDQDSSSHHDGDIDDDVFSEESGRSQRSSINSVHDLNSSDEAYQKTLNSPVVGEEAATSHASESVSRIPSIASYIPEESDRTPSKVLNRPPFRTPSSVRAIQMGSPTPSLFSSPRSAKRHLPTVSRIGTPTSQYSPSKRTPTRFKAKKEQPLVLLHVTIMPLQWPYAHTMALRDFPESLRRVKESWGLLQTKLADTVLERGVLLPHPQDSYEVLEEHLLEALELPVRPRAEILKCGHYMGPLDLDTPSSEDETTESYPSQESGNNQKWCDICQKDVKLEDTSETAGKRRFNVKVYASNGLMRAGAWAAVWREMERVDVEIEPWVDIELRSELEHLASMAPMEAAQEEDDGFVDEEEDPTEERALEAVDVQEVEPSAEEAEIRRKFEEEELAHKLMAEEELRREILEEEERRKREEDDLRRKMMDEQRMREIYGHPAPPPMENAHHRPQQRSPRQVVDPDSLPELLLAAFKVLMRDKKNIAIGVLSVLVLFLALRPSSPNYVSVPEQPRVLTTTAYPKVEADAPTMAISMASRPTLNPVEIIPEAPKEHGETAKENAPVLEIKPTPEPCVPIEPEKSKRDTSAPEVEEASRSESAKTDPVVVRDNEENVPTIPVVDVLMDAILSQQPKTG